MPRNIVVDIAQLELDRALNGPIYDSSGRLLLKAGSVLTDSRRKRMVERGVTRVIVNESDVSGDRVEPESQKDDAFQQLANALDDRLKSLLKSGMMTIRNTGPALAHSVVRHGNVGYDTGRQEQIVETQTKHCEKAAGLLGETANGGSLDVRSVNEVATSCTSQLLGDCDATLAGVAMLAQGESIANHSLKVTTVALAIGVEMGLDEKNIRTLATSAMLADLGMYKVSPEVLQAPRVLTLSEFVSVQRHAIQTANLLEKQNGRLNSLTQIIAYQVHETCDGRGYPRCRPRKSIHPMARIIHIADSYVAMTSPRPYRPPIMPYAAMRSLLVQAGQGRIDPVAVKALLHAVSLFPIGSQVQLSDGSPARVIRANSSQISEPIVQLQDTDGSDDGGAGETIDLTKSDLKIVRAVPSATSGELVSDPRISAAEADVRGMIGLGHNTAASG